jgi:hypothetical protein
MGEPHGPDVFEGVTDGTARSNIALKVLMVDDEPAHAELVRHARAADRGIALHFCPDPKRAVVTAENIKPTIIIQDHLTGLGITSTSTPGLSGVGHDESIAQSAWRS